MKNGLKRIFSLLLILLPLTITAAPTTVKVTVNLPTTNLDGSPLTNLAYIQFWCSESAGGPYVMMTQEVTPAAPSVGDKISTVADNCMTTQYGSVYFVALSVSSLGEFSTYGEEGTLSFLPNPVPVAPSNILIEAGN